MNKSTYNLLATDYENKIPYNLERSKPKVDIFIDVLKSRFHNNINILEVGCGVGTDLYYLEKNNLKVVAVDISNNMIQIAKEYVKNVEYICADYLDLNFDDESFCGIFSKAFIHLFPKEIAILILKNFYKILKTRGVAFIGTSIHDNMREGYTLKEDYSIKSEIYRVNWTKDELIKSIQSVGFYLHSLLYHRENKRNLNWLGVIAVKPFNRIKFKNREVIEIILKDNSEL